MKNFIVRYLNPGPLNYFGCPPCERKETALQQGLEKIKKRNDARLVLLALVVNREGFIKFFFIHGGNRCNRKKSSNSSGYYQDGLKRK